MRAKLPFIAALLTLGIGWGSTQSLGKIAAAPGHGPFALILWQVAIGVIVLGAILIIQGKQLALNAQKLRFAVIIALVGTIIPNSAFYVVIRHLPAGIMSILISTVPLISFPLAMVLGLDRFSALRLGGLLCGVLGVAMIAVPNASLPDKAMAAWLPVAMLGPLCYAAEVNIVAKWGTAGLDPVQAMFCASFTGVLFALPLTVFSGQWYNPLAEFGAPEVALAVSSTVHALMYAGYVALAARAGAVFASQSSYIVTGSGVLWSMLLLDERFSNWVWAALCVMLAGLFLVSPRPKPARET